MHRRDFLTFVVAGTVGALLLRAGGAQSVTPTAGGDLVQLTLDIQGMH